MISQRLVEQVVNKCVKSCIPYAVMFELTYRCNLSCRHCLITGDNGNNGAELSTEEIKGIIDQLVEMRTFFLAFTGGEIFLREDLFEIARHAKKRGFLLTLMTNGTLLTPEMIKEIKKMKPVKFEVSLYGASAKTHDHITGVDGSFERTVEAVKGLTEAGINVTTKSVLMNLNIREYEDMKALSEKLGAYPRINPGLLPKKDGSLQPLQYDLSFDEMEKYLPKDNDDILLDYLSEHKDASDRLTCKAGKSGCSISPDGSVYPCILMPIKVGSLRKNSLKEIWHIQPDENLKRLRALTSADVSTCYRCDLVQYCIRCPGTAYLETGSLLGASPSACRYAKWRKYCKAE